MKRKIKGLLLALCMVLGVMGLTGCSTDTQLKDSVETLSEERVGAYKTTAAQTIQAVVGFTDEQMEQFQVPGIDAFSASAIESWENAKPELGEFQEITEQAVEEKGSQIIILSKAVFEKGTANVEMILDNATGVDMPESMAFNVNYSLAETMKMAGLNTLMGIGIVFLMLLFLSFIIAQFKHIAKLEEKFTKKEEETAPAVADVSEEEEELVDDGELVAVIAALIAASENTSTDSFVVRSIKKSNARRWKRA